MHLRKDQLGKFFVITFSFNGYKLKINKYMKIEYSLINMLHPVI